MNITLPEIHAVAQRILERDPSNPVRLRLLRDMLRGRYQVNLLGSAPAGLPPGWNPPGWAGCGSFQKASAI